MEKLPNEMLSKILMYLDMKQLFNLSLVSKKKFIWLKK